MAPVLKRLMNASMDSTSVSGNGVDPQDMERIFHAFYTTKSAGMGVGLSISRSIIERHQGRLWADSDVDTGATFQFSIPRAAVLERARNADDPPTSPEADGERAEGHV